MSTQITTAFVNEYKSGVEFLLQQKGSKLRGAVRLETQNGEYDYYDQIGVSQAQKVNNRHGDTPLVNTPHGRRRVGLTDYDWADLIDKPDKVRTLNDPTSSYVQAASMALGRAIDSEIITAFNGTAYAGQSGGTSVPFPASQQVAVNYTGANKNLVYEKLIAAKEALTVKDGGDMDEEFFLAVTQYQISSLLKTTQVTSSDYNTVKALVNGEVDTFVGFKFIVLADSLMPKSGNNRSVFAWRRSGMLLAMGQDINVDISLRNDKRNSTQVYASLSCGATRMQEEKVVEVLCDETA